MSGTHDRRTFLKASTAVLAGAPFVLSAGVSSAQPVGDLADDPTLGTLVPTALGGPSPARADTLTIRWLGCANHELRPRLQAVRRLRRLSLAVRCRFSERDRLAIQLRGAQCDLRGRVVRVDDGLPARGIG